MRMSLLNEHMMKIIKDNSLLWAGNWKNY